MLKLLFSFHLFVAIICHDKSKSCIFGGRLPVGLFTTLPPKIGRTTGLETAVCLESELKSDLTRCSYFQKENSFSACFF